MNKHICKEIEMLTELIIKLEGLLKIYKDNKYLELLAEDVDKRRDYLFQFFNNFLPSKK